MFGRDGFYHAIDRVTAQYVTIAKYRGEWYTRFGYFIGRPSRVGYIAGVRYAPLDNRFIPRRDLVMPGLS